MPDARSCLANDAERKEQANESIAAMPRDAGCGGGRRVDKQLIRGFVHGEAAIDQLLPGYIRREHGIVDRNHLRRVLS